MMKLCFSQNKIEKLQWRNKREMCWKCTLTYMYILKIGCVLLLCTIMFVYQIVFIGLISQ